MKKPQSIFLRLFCVFLTAVSAVPEYAFAQASIAVGTPFEVIADRGLNVRQKPNARKIGAIPKGAMMYSTGEPKNNWLPVQYRDEAGFWVNGYVSMRYARQEPVPDDAESRPGMNQPSNSLSQQEGRVLNLSIRVNTRARLRTGPSTSTGIADRLTNNTNVEVVGQPRGNWIPVKVTATGKLGWVHATLLESDFAVNGERNPIEVADGHAKTAEEAASAISQYHDQNQTEAGITEVCTNCEVQPPLDRLPTVGDEVSHAFQYPVSGTIRITSNYGYRIHPILRTRRLHKGVDLGMPTGTSVRATQSGKVVQVISNCRVGSGRCGGGYGNYVVVEHSNGMTSLYAHLKSSGVRVGQQVAAGQEVGKSGNTGRSTGPHLHFEIRNSEGTAIDPIAFIRNRGT